MRWFILLLLAAGAIYWWSHRELTTSPLASEATETTIAIAPAPAAAADPSWPKRNLNQAQSALDAVKQQREEL